MTNSQTKEKKQYEKVLPDSGSCVACSCGGVAYVLHSTPDPGATFRLVCVLCGDVIELN